MYISEKMKVVGHVWFDNNSYVREYNTNWIW